MNTNPLEPHWGRIPLAPVFPRENQFHLSSKKHQASCSEQKMRWFGSIAGETLRFLADCYGIGEAAAQLEAAKQMGLGQGTEYNQDTEEAFGNLLSICFWFREFECWAVFSSVGLCVCVYWSCDEEPASLNMFDLFGFEYFRNVCESDVGPRRAAII